MYGVYNGNIAKWRIDEQRIYDELMSQALANGDTEYASQTLRWADENDSVDDDGKRVMKIPPQRIRDNIPGLQHISERAQRLTSP